MNEREFFSVAAHGREDSQKGWYVHHGEACAGADHISSFFREVGSTPPSLALLELRILPTSLNHPIVNDTMLSRKTISKPVRQHFSNPMAILHNAGSAA